MKIVFDLFVSYYDCFTRKLFLNQQVLYMLLIPMLIIQDIHG